MAQRVTSLGPKPSLFFVFCAFWLSCFCFNWKSWFSPLKWQFLLFSLLCFPLFLLAFFLASPFFTFSFFVSLSLSLSCYLISSLFPVSHFCFWFLFFCFCCVCFLVSRCYLVFFFFFLLVVVFWITILDLFLLYLLFSCCCFLNFVAFIFCYFLSFGYQSNLWKLWKLQKKNAKMKKKQKKESLTRAVSTGVLTTSVFFLFCVSLNFAVLLKTLYK